ncbi:MAG: hypothetical protein U1E76_11190 [Planctomycetota bacterium]
MLNERGTPATGALRPPAVFAERGGGGALVIVSIYTRCCVLELMNNLALSDAQ